MCNRDLSCFEVVMLDPDTLEERLFSLIFRFSLGQRCDVVVQPDDMGRLATHILPFGEGETLARGFSAHLGCDVRIEQLLNEGVLTSGRPSLALQEPGLLETALEVLGELGEMLMQASRALVVRDGTSVSALQ